jgi:hypothetical protein
VAKESVNGKLDSTVIGPAFMINTSLEGEGMQVFHNDIANMNKKKHMKIIKN